MREEEGEAINTPFTTGSGPKAHSVDAYLGLTNLPGPFTLELTQHGLKV